MYIEPEPGVFNFTLGDQIANLASQYGLVLRGKQRQAKLHRVYN